MGSQYLTLELLFIVCVIYLINQKEKISKRIWAILICLLNIAMLQTYTLYATTIILAEATVFILKYKKEAIKYLPALAVPLISVLIYLKSSASISSTLLEVRNNI